MGVLVLPNVTPKRLNGITATLLLDFNISNKIRIKSRLRCLSHDFFVPLYCQNERALAAALRIKIARFKSRNCAH